MAAGMVSLVILVAACTSSPAPTSPSATTAAQTQTPATSSPPPSAVRAQPIPDGSYVATTTTSALKATIDAVSTLTAADKADLLQNLAGHTIQLVRLDLKNGQFTQSQAFDGGAYEVGVRATYAFPDAHTLVEQEPRFGVTTFELTVSKNSFFLKRTSAPNVGLYGGTKQDAMMAELLFESGPFTSSSASVTAIPEGSYVGKTLQVANMIASITADTKLTDAEKNQLIDDVLAIRGHATFTPTFEFRDGKYAQGVQMDGGPATVGSRGTYASPDATTLVLQEQTVTTFHMSWASESFSLAHAGTPNEFDRVIFKFLFEPSFSLVP